MPARKFVHVVEHREEPWDIVVVFIATSRAKAHAFCRANPDFGDKGTNWWWAIYRVPLNEDTILYDNELEIMLPDGTLTYRQPLTE